MKDSEIQKLLDATRGQALVFHGFTDYARDYDLIVFRLTDALAGRPATHLRYRFTHCLHALVEIGLPLGALGVSLGDELLDPSEDKVIGGYPWGVRWQLIEPGGYAVMGSREAKRWAKKLDIPMHEVRIRVAAQNITLVFSDLKVTEVEPGWHPFVVGSGDQDVPVEDDAADASEPSDPED